MDWWRQHNSDWFKHNIKCECHDKWGIDEWKIENRVSKCLGIKCNRFAIVFLKHWHISSFLRKFHLCVANHTREHPDMCQCWFCRKGISKIKPMRSIQRFRTIKLKKMMKGQESTWMQSNAQKTVISIRFIRRLLFIFWEWAILLMPGEHRLLHYSTKRKCYSKYSDRAVQPVVPSQFESGPENMWD